MITPPDVTAPLAALARMLVVCGDRRWTASWASGADGLSAGGDILKPNPEET